MTSPASGGRRFEAVVFDLDGVLVDSEIWWDEVRADLARRNGRAWTEADRVAVMGQNSRQWAETMRERLGLATPAEVIEREVVDAVLERYRGEGPPVIPGAVDVVRRVGRDLRTAVASSAHREVIDAALTALGLEDDLDVVVSSDEVARGKPDPAVYVEAARRLGVAPSACLVVEDSLNGVLAGRAAGMTVALVPNASIPPAPGTREAASVVRDRLAEIVELLDLPTETGRVAGDVPMRPGGPNLSPRDRRLPDDRGNPENRASGAPARRVARSRPELPGPPVGRVRRTLRYWLAGMAIGLVVRSYVRLRVEGRERLPDGPAVLCFNHQSWADPFVLIAALPLRPRLYFFGPKEEDMAVGARNRLMSWVGTAVPYRPGKNDLIGATRRVGTVFAAGGALAIAGEGRIHAGERSLLPLSDGPAFFALRGRVPLVPVAVNGTSWLAFGRTVRVRIGEPLEVAGRPTGEHVEDLTAQAAAALRALVADFPDRRPPGRFGRWLTELFNDWPEGSRPGAVD